MSFQSRDIWSRFWSYTWEALFGIVIFCGIMVVLNLVNHLIKVYKNKSKFTVNKLSLAFFITSPILIIILLVSELWWRINAFYGVSTFYVSYWYEYLIFSLANYFVILTIWIIKNIYTKRFVQYKEEINELKKSFINFGQNFKKNVFNLFKKIKLITINLPNYFQIIIKWFRNPSFKFPKSKTKILDKVFSPARGKVVPLSSVQDKTFSEGHLGVGFAVIPKAGEKSFLAPVSGEIVSLFHTYHAYGIKTNNNTNVLVHIGIDTVKLKGKHFKALKKVGDKVKIGDPIIAADLKLIKKAGYDTTTIVVCTQETQGNINILDKKINNNVDIDSEIIIIS